MSHSDPVNQTEVNALPKNDACARLEVDLIASLLPQGARVLHVGAASGSFALRLSQATPLKHVCVATSEDGTFADIERDMRQKIPTSHRILRLSASFSGHDDAMQERVEDAQRGVGPVDKCAAPLTSHCSDPYASITQLCDDHGPFDLIRIDAGQASLKICKELLAILRRDRAILWLERDAETRAIEVYQTFLDDRMYVLFCSFSDHEKENAAGAGVVHSGASVRSGLLVSSARLSAPTGKFYTVRPIHDCDTLRSMMRGTLVLTPSGKTEGSKLPQDALHDHGRKRAGAEFVSNASSPSASPASGGMAGDEEITQLRLALVEADARVKDLESRLARFSAQALDRVTQQHIIWDEQFREAIEARVRQTKIAQRECERLSAQLHDVTHSTTWLIFHPARMLFCRIPTLRRSARLSRQFGARILRGFMRRTRSVLTRLLHVR